MFFHSWLSGVSPAPSLFFKVPIHWYPERKVLIKSVLILSGDASYYHAKIHLRNEFNFWNVHGIMNTSGLFQSKLTGFHDSRNIPKVKYTS